MKHSYPRQDGRVAIVTGANTGIGLVTARELAKLGAHVFLACRSEERTKPVLADIRAAAGHDKVEFLPLDLGDLGSVRAAAATFLARDLPLHLLVNNAGLAGLQGFTSSGFELAFGTNHVGHFLFTTLLEAKLRASAPARIVNVSSKSHYRARGIAWEAARRPTETFAGLREYEVSKLANVLFTKEHARRLEGSGVTTYALHPGVIASDIWKRVPAFVRPVVLAFMRSTDEGAETSLHCALSPDLATQTGRYYDDCKERRPSRLADDASLAAELWTRSEAWVA